jgi:lambda repressor-like predicted transcriptional regulator
MSPCLKFSKYHDDQLCAEMQHLEHSTGDYLARKMKRQYLMIAYDIMVEPVSIDWNSRYRGSFSSRRSN